jgi:butyryl-CoA dehydrogenase
MDGGAAFDLLLSTMRRDIDIYRSVATVQAFALQLEDVLAQLSLATRAMQATASDERAYSANATLYLDMLGHVVIAWMWLRQAGVASRALEAGAAGDEHDFYQGKLAACSYFYAYELGRLDHWLPILASANPLFVVTEPRWL